MYQVLKIGLVGRHEPLSMLALQTCYYLTLYRIQQLNDLKPILFQFKYHY